MVEIIVAVVSAFAGAALSWGYQEFIAKRTMAQERFQKLYAPFEKMVLLRTHGAHNFSSLEPALREDFIRLLLNNYEYADSVLKLLIVQFKWCLDSEIKDDGDKTFYLIERHVSEGFNKLSRKLFLEPFKVSVSKKALRDWDKLP